MQSCFYCFVEKQIKVKNDVVTLIFDVWCTGSDGNPLESAQPIRSDERSNVSEEAPNEV